MKFYVKMIKGIFLDLYSVQGSVFGGVTKFGSCLFKGGRDTWNCFEDVFICDVIIIPY